MRDIMQWADLVGGSIRLADPDDAWPIAILCYDAERNGGIVNTWHNSAVFYNCQCHCAICSPSKPVDKPQFVNHRNDCA